MASAAELDRRLYELEAARRSRPGAAVVLDLLAGLADASFADGGALVRFHEVLLFFRAYPDSPRVARAAEALLRGFHRRVRAIRDSRQFERLLDIDVSGIAGTYVETSTYTYECVRWLCERFPRRVSVDWDVYDAPDRIAAVLRPFLPLLEEESFADANVAFVEWMRAARAMDGSGGLLWLLRNLDRLDVPPLLRADIFNALGLFIRWDLDGSPASRTRMRRASRNVFCHRGPLLTRRDVSIERELSNEPLPVRRLQRREGAAVLDMARAAMATRYRELYGFIHGDPSCVISADAGRGVEILVCGIVAQRRLPIRAGFGTFLVKNGVPIGYADAYGIGRRLDISLNLFSAFRDGESAWCFARMLKLYHQSFGSAVFSLDPYQIGHENDEAIRSGAFWFYRKLGFRSTDPSVEALARREEEAMARDTARRTSPRMLRRMALSALVYEVPGARGPSWNRFHIRNVGLAVQRAMARSGLRPDEFRAECRARAAAALRLRSRSLTSDENEAFERMAPLLAVIPELPRWSDDDRAMLVDAIRAKASRRESVYLQLTSCHEPFQRALSRLGTPRR